MQKAIQQYLTTLEKKAIPQLSVNCVIVGFHEKKLQILVNKISLEGNSLMLLPGGYVMQAESVVEAVARVAKESTGLEKITFRQFAVFGEASRSFGHEIAYKKVMKCVRKKALEWVTRRFVSICYLALVDFGKIKLKPTPFLETAQWLPLDKAATLSLDHEDIVKSAREFLVKELPHAPIASHLLPTRFTLPELQALVEAILGADIDRPNFRRKILKTGMLAKVGTDRSGKRRPADVYTFRHGKKTSLMDGYKLGF